MANFHYQSNLRDIEFNLFEYLKIQDTTLGRGEFKSMDEDTARETLRGLQKKRAEATGTEKIYYEGKVASARFFCKTVLPHISETRKIVEASALDLMELDEAAF